MAAKNSSVKFLCQDFKTHLKILKMRKWSWLSSPMSQPVSSAEFFQHVQVISNTKFLLSLLQGSEMRIFVFLLNKILAFFKDIFLYSSRIAAKSYALWMPIPAISGPWPELILMVYVSGLINLAKESLKLLFESNLNRHIDPSEF